jgi:hypothetical protein
MLQQTMPPNFGQWPAAIHLQSLTPRLSWLPLLGLGCGLLSFTVRESGVTRVDGAGPLGTVLDVLDLAGLEGLDVSIEQEMADQGVEPGDLREVVLTELALSAEPDLAFLDSIEIWVEADGVEPVLVAEGIDFPEGQARVELVTTGENFADHVAATGMSFRVDASGRAPDDDTDVTVDVAVRVEATAQGACNASKN